MKTIAVLAGRHQEFADFCKERKLRMRSVFFGYSDDADYIYITSPRDVLGRHFDGFERIGSFTARCDAVELADAVQTRLKPSAG